LHWLLVSGVTVGYRTREAEIRGAGARAIDFDKRGSNDWAASRLALRTGKPLSWTF